MEPGEIISIDYMHDNNQNVLVIKYKMSRFITARLSKNQTSQSAYSYGLPHKICSNRGSTFRDHFSKKLGIKPTLTSPYNSQSNGGLEQTNPSLKEVLKMKEVRKTDNMILQEICLRIITHKETKDKRFLKHEVIVSNHEDAPSNQVADSGNDTERECPCREMRSR